MSPSEQPVVRRAVTVTGRVQGVSFRYHTVQQAERLGLTGWVRNHDDGSVRLEVQGPADAVAELVGWLHHGPSHARVDGVREDAVDVRDGEAGFRAVR
ncbi:acylphosphatase [Acidimicrobiia bacterium EGI L10123]|uniref:acylphosphatase n=1 Tax=Salinilacustrithrix flava TaxID=2957203 RepID=UPI003D7C32C4|nr:acylphosphatase [Acidimicrobiia bacterium EGI L10123]